MPRVTKVMLEHQNKYLRRRETELCIEVAHLKEKIGLLLGPHTMGGQTTALHIAVEKITDSLAHVLSSLDKHEEWRERWHTSTIKNLDSLIQKYEMLNARSTTVSSRTPRTRAKGGTTKTKTKS